MGPFFAPASRPARIRLVAMTLDVPLEGAADGLVEVVDVEDEAGVDAGEGAEVADVGVTAELGVDARVGPERQVGGHDRRSSAEEAEGRGGHAVVLDGDEGGNTAAHGVGEELERVGGAGFRPPCGEIDAAGVLALGLAEGQALAGCEGDGHGLIRVYWRAAKGLAVVIVMLRRLRLSEIAAQGKAQRGTDLVHPRGAKVSYAFNQAIQRDGDCIVQIYRTGRLHASPRTTSEGTPRMLDAMGATVTVAR